jgi:hypothetical protein
MKTFLAIICLLVSSLTAQINPVLVAVANTPPPEAGGGIIPEVAWWKLNDGSGTSAADSTGNGNTGTLSGTPAWIGSTGLSFDGTDDFITVANESNFDFERDDAFSITAWIRVNISATGTRGVWNKESPSGNQPGIVFSHDSDNARMRASLTQSDGGGFAFVTGNNSVVHSTWYFVCLTYDGSSTGAGALIYIDAGTPTAGSGTLTGSILNDAAVLIGKTPGFFFGDMDDVRVYNRELSSTEVTDLFNGGAE